MAKKEDNRDIFEKALDDDRKKTEGEDAFVRAALVGGGVLGNVLGGRTGRFARGVILGRKRYGSRVGSIIEGAPTIAGTAGGAVVGARLAAESQKDAREKRKRKLYEDYGRRK